MVWEQSGDEIRDGLGMVGGENQGWFGNGRERKPGIVWERQENETRDGLGAVRGCSQGWFGNGEGMKAGMVWEQSGKKSPESWDGLGAAGE